MLRNSCSAILFIAALTMVAGCAGCSEDTVPADTSGGEDTDQVDATDGSVDDTGKVVDAKDPDDGKDVDPPDTVDPVDTADTKESVDTGPPPICTADGYCLEQLASKLTGCTTAICNTQNECEIIDKVGFCCDDADCDDKVECTIDSCDVGTFTCKSKLDENCVCPGKEQLLDEGFEQKGLGEFKATAGKDNGNVTWHIDPKRHHSGKNALYLGNECYTYDNSESESNDCTANPAGGKPVIATLTSSSLNLPANKPVIAHFWLWLKAEPKLTEELKDKSGKVIKKALTASDKCSPAKCGPGQTCVKLPASGDKCDPACKSSEFCQAGKCIPAAQCLPENDVLLVYLDVPGGKSKVVWDSSTLKNKSTDGWQHVAINVNKDAAGEKSVQLRWEFRTNNGNLNGFEGVWLDDIRVETICVEKDPAKFKDCKVGTPCTDAKNVCLSPVCTPYASGKQTPKDGVCLYDQAPGCCQTDLHCDDKQDCTDDVCDIAKGAKSGTCKNTPQANNPQCCQPENLFKDNFNNGLIAWSHTESSKDITWHATSKDDASGGAGSICFGNANCDGYADKTLKKVDGMLCSKAVKLKAGTQYDMLSFELKMKTEWCGQDKAKYKNPPCPPKSSCLDYKLDHFAVKLKIGGKLEEIWSSDAIQGCTDDKWLPLLVPLNAWQGKTVNVCFEFDTGDAFANDKGGVRIDDVSLDVKCKQEVCNEKNVKQNCPAKDCQALTCPDGACHYEPIAGCCKADKDCDDGDTCTTETCNKKESLCEYKTPDPKCCKVDKVGDKAILAQDFEVTGGLPSGWKFKCLSGSPELPGQQYTCDIKWYVTTVKAKLDPNASPPKVKSLHFGKAGGLINVAGKAPAGAIESPEVMVPSGGTSLISFDVLLKTEWSKSAGGVWNDNPPPFAIDQLQVLLVDVAAQKADPTKGIEKIWDSYEIKGTTDDVWKFIVIKVPAKYAGKAVRLRLVFDAGSSGKNQVEGAFVDNIRLETLCATPACVADKDCPPKGTKVDSCKNYFCGKDDKGLFACQSAQKSPAPEGCCVPKLLLPLETAEGNSLSKWADDNKDPKNLPDVRWQVVPHKYLFDKFEIYYGNPKNWNYADGSLKSCKATSECSSGEACTGETGKKVCVKPVKGKLTSAVIDLSQSPKEGVELGFHVWADIEPSFETFEVWVLTANGVPIEKVWDHKVALVPKSNLKKVAPQKVDLSKFKSKTQIKVEFRFDSVDGNKNNLFGGIHLDNLRVDQICLP